MTINLSRRGFLRGIIAAGIAPIAIKTSGLLMPIKPGLIISPTAELVTSTMLTPAMITKETLRLLSEYRAEKRRFTTFSLGSSQIPAEELAGKQVHVDLEIPQSDFTLSLDKFAAKHLKQVVFALAPHIGADASEAPSLPPEVARSLYGYAREQFDGVGMRYLSDYDIGRDIIVHRFDVKNA